MEANVLSRPKVLLLDDDQKFLELYREIFQRLPSEPEILSATSGQRALSLLEEGNVSLLIVDLNMPKMDGLQILSIARRRFPELRLMVLTGIRDEQFRARAYAMGVDQFWLKPESKEEVDLLLEAAEAMLRQQAEGGFRGVQSKNLVDIIQLECLSQTSAVLKFTNSLNEARVWLQNGDIIDAEVQDLKGEPAFHKLISWKSGSFETLPPEPGRPRTIFSSYQGLLLESARVLDEAAVETSRLNENPAEAKDATVSCANLALAELVNVPGVEYAIAVGEDGNGMDAWGLETAGPVAEWAKRTTKQFDVLAEVLQVGQLQHIVGMGQKRHVALAQCEGADLCVGLRSSMSIEDVRKALKSIQSKWAS